MLEHMTHERMSAFVVSDGLLFAVGDHATMLFWSCNHALHCFFYLVVSDLFLTTACREKRGFVQKIA